MRRIIGVTILFMIYTGFVLAQPGQPGEPIPIDGGLIWLMIAGGAIGIKKLFDHSKRKN